MSGRETRIVLRAGMAAGLAVLAFGCAPGEVRPQADADAARALLTQTLDAWKAGQKPEDLRSANPVVYVTDEDWSAGRRLTGYELVDEPVPNGSHWRVFAKLTLQGDRPARPAAKSKPAARKVCYAVSPGSPASVSRSDFLN